MVRLLSSVFDSSKSSKPSVARKAQIGLEVLENRLVPAGINIVYGTQLWIEGTEKHDTASVQLMNNGQFRFQVNNDVKFFSYEQLSTLDIYFYGYGGNDTITNSTGLRTSIDGGPGNDTLTGGVNMDFIYGSSGNDIIDGDWGEDYLYGGSGKDQIYAGYDSSYNYLDGEDGDDKMWGGLGFDYMMGRAGNDLIKGYFGDDFINGGAGNDDLQGQSGMDQIYGGDGNDVIEGGHGEDYLFGEAGNDILRSYSMYFSDSETTYNYLDGGDGNDTLIGSDGFDYLVGGRGKDKLYANGGDDTLVSGVDGQVDTLYGGTGRDTFHIEASLKVLDKIMDKETIELVYSSY